MDGLKSKKAPKVSCGLVLEIVDIRVMRILPFTGTEMLMNLMNILVINIYGLLVNQFWNFMENRKNLGRSWTADIFTKKILLLILLCLHR